MSEREKERKEWVNGYLVRRTDRGTAGALSTIVVDPNQPTKTLRRGRWAECEAYAKSLPKAEPTRPKCPQGARLVRSGWGWFHFKITSPRCTLRQLEPLSCCVIVQKENPRELVGAVVMLLECYERQYLCDFIGQAQSTVEWNRLAYAISQAEFLRIEAEYGSVDG
jgi:hypothetical protein